MKYGFGLSATREVARERQHSERLARTVADVQGGKLALTGVVTVLSLPALALVPAFREDPRLAAFAWALALLQGLSSACASPRGVEFIVRLLAAAAIILLVRDPEHGLLLLCIWTASAAASLVILKALMYRTVPFQRPSAAGARSVLRLGWPLFKLTAATSLYTTATVFMLGLVVSSVQLALFAAAERGVRATLRAAGILGTATYPRVSLLLRAGRDDRAQRLSLLALAAMVALSVAAATGLLVLAPWIVRVFLGEEFAEAAPVLRILSLLVPLVVISATLSGPWLLPRGLDREPTRVMIAAGLVNLVLTLTLGAALGVIAVAWGLVAIEIGVAASMVVLITRAGVPPSAAQLRRAR